ncbi:MAG: EAL domain-containing protein [Lachnospiraceae bacterium]|nr:EAL domain-containing protein [Lachnospiraceae bacterium]
MLILLAVDCLGSLTDIISCFCISFPDRHSEAFNIFMCLSYLFLYNLMGILFLVYIDSKTKIKALYTPMRIYFLLITAFEFVLIFTSQWTRLVAYFDENDVYCHGPLMGLLYFLAAMHLIISVILFIIKRRRFNKYQVMAIVAFIIVVFLGVYIQLIQPELLVGQFGNTLVLFFIYTSLENPVYYTYRATTCFNRAAFREIIKMKRREKEKINLFIFKIKDYDVFRESLSNKEQMRLSSIIAEYISSLYRYNAFCIEDDKFAIQIKDAKAAEDIRLKLDKFLARSLILIESRVDVIVNSLVIMDIDLSDKADIIENGIIYALDHNLSENKQFDFLEVVDKLKRRRDISNIVRNAVEKDLFDVYYQPIRSVETGKFKSCEALIRLIDTEYGFISPEEFIPIAESEGLIVKIGEIVFKKVCKFMNEYMLTSKFGVEYVEINLSPIQLVEKDIVEKFKEIMNTYNVSPNWINLEITETANQSNEDVMISNIAEFHKLGMSFSLDDYGSGFASADYLFRYPVEIVKIDKSILWQAMDDVNAGIVLIGTLSLLKSLGKEIVVEGVETEEMVSLLQDNGVDFLQGYYYSKPLRPYEYIDFLRNNNL